MRILSIQKLKEYWEKHNDAEIPLRDWYAKVERAQWTCFNDIKKNFNSVDYVGDQKYVFNIKGTPLTRSTTISEPSIKLSNALMVALPEYEL